MLCCADFAAFFLLLNPTEVLPSARPADAVARGGGRGRRGRAGRPGPRLGSPLHRDTRRRRGGGGTPFRSKVKKQTTVSFEVTVDSQCGGALHSAPGSRVAAPRVTGAQARVRACVCARELYSRPIRSQGRTLHGRGSHPAPSPLSLNRWHRKTCDSQGRGIVALIPSQSVVGVASAAKSVPVYG